MTLFTWDGCGRTLPRSDIDYKLDIAIFNPKQRLNSENEVS